MTNLTAFSKELPSALGDYFTNFFNTNKHMFDKEWTEDSTYVLKLYGLTEPHLMWQRWDAAANSEEYMDKIEEMLDFLEIEYTNYSSFIKTEYLPVGVHVDSEFNPKKDKEFYYNFNSGGVPHVGPGYSVILPINTFGEHHETAVFKPTAVGNPELLEKIMDYFENGVVAENWKLHNNKFNLDYVSYNHVDMGVKHDGKCLLDYLEIENVLQWRENTALAFHKQHYHTSVNFRRYGITQKDFILVHTSSYPYS